LRLMARPVLWEVKYGFICRIWTMMRHLDLSFIIPAYNEEARLPSYLFSIREYLKRFSNFRYEVLVVDDGSDDGLQQILEQLARDWPALRWLRHDRRRGKGAAVRSGVLAACGELVLFADADGATPIQEEMKLRQAAEAGADVVVGSRLLPGPYASQKRRWLRSVLGRSFAWTVQRFWQLPVKDTQCGFKLFRREAALRLFRRCDETGYLFDLEVLIRAHQSGYRIVEIPVTWTDKPGSKVRLVSDGWKMLCGLWRLRRLFPLKPNAAGDGLQTSFLSSSFFAPVPPPGVPSPASWFSPDLTPSEPIFPYDRQRQND
jgi:dolichyl-phosphate beta-glucosyltransferase